MVACRRHTLRPLDDCLSALQATLPHLPRSALPRCCQRQGSSRLPDIEGDKPAKKKFTPSPMGYCPRDSAEVRTEGGQPSWCVAIDRVGKFADAAWHDEASTVVAAPCLRNRIAAVP